MRNFAQNYNDPKTRNLYSEENIQAYSESKFLSSDEEITSRSSEPELSSDRRLTTDRMTGYDPVFYELSETNFDTETNSSSLFTKISTLFSVKEILTNNHKFESNIKVHDELSTGDNALAEFFNEQEIKLLENFIQIREITPLEKIETMDDSWPFLELRKAILRIKNATIEFSYFITTNIFFEIFIILAILANTIVLALDDPSINKTDLEKTWFNNINDAFLYIFSIECALKITGNGLITAEKAYLKNPWNIFDFLILFISWLDKMIGSGANLLVLRTFRIFRNITAIEGVKILFLSLVGSLWPLLNAFVILFFFLTIFSIAGIQLWLGSFKYHCMEITNGKILEIEHVCIYSACPDEEICVKGLDNPFFGMYNFDNIFWAWLSTLMSITEQGWFDYMVTAEMASNNIVAYLFFIPLVFIGVYMLLNLNEVILYSNFTKYMNELRLAKKIQNNDVSLHSSLIENMNLDSFDEDSPYKIEINGRGINNLDGDADAAIEENEKSLLQEDFRKFNKSKTHMAPTRKSEIFTMHISQEETPKSEFFISKLKTAIERSGNFSSMISINSNEPKGNLIGENSSDENQNQGDSLESIDFTLPRKRAKLRKKTRIQPLSVVKRTKSVFKIGKGLQHKIKKKKNSDKGVIFSLLENSAIIYESINDIFPIPKQIPLKKQLNYTFCYRDGSEIYDKLYSLTQFWNNEITDFLAKFNDMERFEIFTKLSTRYNMKKAFYLTTINTHEIIKSVRNNDLFDQKIIGDWSAFDVNPNKGTVGDEWINELNNINYRIWKKGIFGLWQKLMFPLKKLLEGKLFSNFMIFCVIINTIALATWHYGIGSTLNNYLSMINYSITIIFIIEMGTKIISFGIKDYSRDKMNIFDAIVTILSLIELLFISGTGSTLSALRAIRIFRIFRVIRVLRLFRYLRFISHLITILSNNSLNIFYLFIFLSLFLIVFAIMGVQFFSGAFDFPEGKARYNFDDFHHSFLTVFQIMTEERVNTVIYNCMRSSKGYAAALFPFIWLILGHFILLNIFLALIFDMFVSDSGANSSEGEKSSNSFKRDNIYSNISQRYQKKRIEKLKMMDSMQELDSDESASLEDLKRSKSKSQVALYEVTYCERSYCIFWINNPIRRFCCKISQSQKFEIFSLIVIIGSTLKLIWDTYLINADSDSSESMVSAYMDIGFTVWFGIEIIIKSITQGLISERHTYLRDEWNILDFTIVSISVIDLSLSDWDFSIIKILRLLRVLRLLRLVTHSVSLKIAISALYESILSIINVAIAMLIVWLIFAILAVSLFAGKLYECSNPLIETQNECESYGLSWEVEDINYDNVPEALLALFILCSREAWPDLMYSAIDGKSPGVAPQTDYNTYAAYFFVIYITTSIFFINLISGVIFEKFNEAKNGENSLASLVLTKQQMAWFELQNLIQKSKPNMEITQKPQNCLRKFVYTICRHWAFEGFILCCIILNMIQMAMYYDGAPASYTEALDMINLVFTFIFILEALLKIFGLGLKNYFHDSWNKFDFAIAAALCVDLALEYSSYSIGIFLRVGPQLARSIKVARVVRGLRLFKFFKSLQELISLISYSIPAILNISAILILIYSIYALLGVFLFNSVEHGEIIDDHTNFENFGNAVLLLFRCSTGEEWPKIMFDCAHHTNKSVTIIFFVSFILLTTFIVINIFVMAILQNYEASQNSSENIIVAFNNDVKIFKSVWAEFTIESRGIRTSYKALPEIMYRLGKDLGVNKSMDTNQVVKVLLSMEIEMDEEGFVYYNDFLFSVMKRKYGKNMKNLQGSSKKLIRNEEADTKRRLRKLRQKSQVNWGKSGISLANKEKKNMIFGFILLKSVINAWKTLIINKHNREISDITPRFFEEEFPGVNTIDSDNQSSST